MTVELLPLPLPPSADSSRFKDFGREVKGLNPTTLTREEYEQVKNALYRHDVLLFRNADLTPEQQYSFTKAFDHLSESYGHGNNKTENTKGSILQALLKTIPRVPQVQLIGNGTIYEHEGIAEAKLKHPSHATFHKTRISPEDEEKGYTRFYRWHMDAALYDLSPPKVTTLYGLKVPKGNTQIVRYDDGTGDELSVPLGTTAFVSGKTMFDILPPELKSLAVRSRVKYSPHPFVWMAPAHAMPTGLGIESEGPIVWKNPVTGELHFEAHPCGAAELFVDPLKEVRDFLYKMQRPAIAPMFVLRHEKDLVLFHNRGVMHSAVGSFKSDQVRVFHQCNLAASDEPVGPTEEDVRMWA